MANIAAELKQFYSQKSLRMWLGQVLPCNKKKVTRVLTYQYEIDDFLKAYFQERRTYFAYDPHKKCKTGDLVLIKELQEKMSPLITHEVMKIVYPLGDNIDPITGRACAKEKFCFPKFRDDYDKLCKIYGESPNRFKYEDAPPRGRLEGIRDFTDKEITMQYHDDGTRSRYKINAGKRFQKPEIKWPLNTTGEEVSPDFKSEFDKIIPE